MTNPSPSVSLLPQGDTLSPFSPPGQRDEPLFPLAFQCAPALAKKTDRARRDALFSWFQSERAWLQAALERHGAMLLRGFGLQDAADFENALENAGFTATPYLGGAAPREKVLGQRILTSNESPPEEPIPFHHEMAQTPNPPAYISFFCEIEPEVGGETPLLYSPKICERFWSLSPDFAEKVEALGVCYRRVMPGVDDPSSPIGRSWRSTFLCEDREEAEEKMRAAGMSWSWQGNDELLTVSAPTPALRSDQRTGQQVFFNSMVAAYTGWQDQRNKASESLTCGDGSPVDGEALLALKEIMDEECAAISWSRGDLLLIDNGLVMHSRRPFQGARRILASIAQGLSL